MTGDRALNALLVALCAAMIAFDVAVLAYLTWWAVVFMMS